jgi:hypothetical protein
MKKLTNRFIRVMWVGLLLCGSALLFPLSDPRVLSVGETQEVMGGTINGVKLKHAGCPASSLACSYAQCNQQTQQCPTNMAETKQLFPTYPKGTEAGSDYANTVPANYNCTSHRFCGQTCTPSTQPPHILYCDAAVGPDIPDPPVAGAQGGDPFVPET